MKQQLTDRQLEVFVYLKEFQKKEQDMPLLKEIAFNFDVSASAAHDQLRKLVAKGYLSKVRNGRYRFTETPA